MANVIMYDLDTFKSSEDYHYIENILDFLVSTNKKYDYNKIIDAFEFAKKLHEGQYRKSGEEYIYHPIAVAEIVASLGLDTDSIVAAFLHDTVEDCADKTNLAEIGGRFGEDVELLVDGLTKMADIHVISQEEAQVENIRKMLLAMSKDIRVIFIKLCDRLHNMRTLNAKVEEKRRYTALETMYVYAPLAHRLGMQKIKQELENLALKYLDPIGYEEVKKNIDEKYGENHDFIVNTKKIVEDKLREYNIGFELEGRVKTVYSIYNKMFNHNKSFDEIYDFYAIRIIVSNELECYTALGIIHEMFKSIPGRFKDYISTPKPNMYQSLHTTVIGHDGIPFEVQIRTSEMHQIAEYGIAAHWKYKSGEKSKAEIDSKLQWISKLIDTENEALDPDDFMHALKIDIFQDETFVFTPKGDVIALPQGATLIDFAYAIHSGVGNKMIGAKINGIISQIDKSPQNGDIVEIITSSSSKGPSRDWLKIVKTNEARTKIKQWFKKEKRSENIEIGREEIEREISRNGRNATSEQIDEIITNVAKRAGMNNPEDLCCAIGYGGLSISKISIRIRDEYNRVVKPIEVEPITKVEQVQTQMPTKRFNSNGGIIVDGEEGCVVKFAKCCNPLPGDAVIGFITKGYGISIHKCDCINIENVKRNPENNDRFVKAEWNIPETTNKPLYEAALQIYCEDRLGILADITAAIADMKVSLLSINSKKAKDETMIMVLSVACKDIEHYNSIVSRVRNIKGVKNIVRGNYL